MIKEKCFIFWNTYCGSNIFVKTIWINKLYRSYLQVAEKDSVQNWGNKTNEVDWSLEPTILKIILPREQFMPGLTSHSVIVTKDFKLIFKAVALKSKTVTYSKFDYLSWKSLKMWL
jgi:hypothetical protein